ncbi:MAG TPA: hypothetical protein VFZ69_05135 [Longimicrobiales bacterium]
MLPERPGRRQFLALLAGCAGALLTSGRAAALVRPRGVAHPEPRPGITAANVLKAEALPPELVELYDGVRRIPQVVDGISCHCGCDGLEGFYSLLTCYEQSGMALHCEVCQGEGELAVRLHAQGRTLDEIRTAIDRRFG